MKIYELLNNIDYEMLQGDVNGKVNNICWDSRKVKLGDLFICVKNRNVDRHDYAIDAIVNGAKTIVTERIIEGIPKNINVIKVHNSRKVMAQIANKYYGNLSDKINLIGVTGTNGKTSISYYVYEILEKMKIKSGIIGTIENSVCGEKLNTEKLNPTTPDCIELQKMFKEIIKNDATHVVMEVSSSALSQDRVYGCNFDIGIFSNFTQDHLEEHQTMENYKKAKMKLFHMCETAIINIDDLVGKEIVDSKCCDTITYGIKGNADFKASDITYSSNGMKFKLRYKGYEKEVYSKLSGEFNVYNILATIATCYKLTKNLDEIILYISEINGAPGRFQVVSNKKGVMSIVDYAHNPNSLENILKSARQICNKKVIVVFGCGGDRDKSKRSIMGKIAGELADMCILTSDNPRTEEPNKIIEEIESGLKYTECFYKKIVDRKEAILYAIKEANQDDIVIIAGKGHEKYQIFKNKTIYFNDVEIIKNYCEV